MPDTESLPAIQAEAEIPEPATEAVLRDFMKTVEGGLTEYDVAVDNDNAPLVIEPGRDDELDMKLYKNVDPLSPLHLARHVPKYAGCPGCDMGKTSKSHSR